MLQVLKSVLDSNDKAFAFWHALWTLQAFSETDWELIKMQGSVSMDSLSTSVGYQLPGKRRDEKCSFVKHRSRIYSSFRSCVRTADCVATFANHGDPSPTPYQGACGQCWSCLVHRQHFIWQNDLAHRHQSPLYQGFWMV